MMDRPLHVFLSEKQYIIDNYGTQYLDCISSNAHVGHCHPQITASAHSQLSKLSASQGFLHDSLSLYVNQLCSIFPDPLDACFLLNSQSEANDLALRLARTYTRNYDVVVFDKTYNGSFGVLMDISPKMFSSNSQLKKTFVHVFDLPESSHLSDTTENEDVICEKCIAKCNEGLKEVINGNRKIACLMSQTVFVDLGVIVPPKNYFKQLYKLIHDYGGVCIVDESQTGLGRLGDNMWGFQHFDVVPDIVTIGNSVGNGFPMAAVITTNEIASSLGEYYSTFGGNPVACSIGLTVLEIIDNEKLLASANAVGKTLLGGFRQLQLHYSIIGDVRGMGLCFGIEIIKDETSREPCELTAKAIIHCLKDTHHILIEASGPSCNILTVTPPMCFNQQNARSLISSLRDVLSAVMKESVSRPVLSSKQSAEDAGCIRKEIDREDVLDDNDAPSTKRFKTDFAYDDLD